MKIKSLKVEPNGHMNGVRIKIDDKIVVPMGALPAQWQVKDHTTVHRDQTTITIVAGGQANAKAKVELDIEGCLELKGEITLEGGLEHLTIKVGDF
jgi:hypothetical protein